MITDQMSIARPEDVSGRAIMTLSYVTEMLRRVKMTLRQLRDVEMVEAQRAKYGALLNYAKQLNCQEEIIRTTREMLTRHQLRIGELLLEKAREYNSKSEAVKYGFSLGLKKSRMLEYMNAVEKFAGKSEQLIDILRNEKKAPTLSALHFVAQGSETSFRQDIHGSLPSNVASPAYHKFEDATIQDYTKHDEWITPRKIIGLAGQALGGISLDPASSAEAQKIVRADTFYDTVDNGLAKPWSGRIWLCAPYKKIGEFTTRILTEYGSERVDRAIIMTVAFTSEYWFQRLLANANAFCFLGLRVSFTYGKTTSPELDTAIFYLGANCDQFSSAFGQIGYVQTNKNSK